MSRERNVDCEETPAIPVTSVDNYASLASAKQSLIFPTVRLHASVERLKLGQERRGDGGTISGLL